MLLRRRGGLARTGALRAARRRRSARLMLGRGWIAPEGVCCICCQAGQTIAVRTATMAGLTDSAAELTTAPRTTQPAPYRAALEHCPSAAAVGPAATGCWAPAPCPPWPLFLVPLVCDEPPGRVELDVPDPLCCCESEGALPVARDFPSTFVLCDEPAARLPTCGAPPAALCPVVAESGPIASAATMQAMARSWPRSGSRHPPPAVRRRKRSKERASEATGPVCSGRPQLKTLPACASPTHRRTQAGRSRPCAWESAY